MHFEGHFFYLEAFSEPFCLFNLVNFAHIHHSESVWNIRFQIGHWTLDIGHLFFADSHIEIDKGKLLLGHLR